MDFAVTQFAVSICPSNCSFTIAVYIVWEDTSKNIAVCHHYASMIHCKGCHDQTYPTNEPCYVIRLAVHLDSKTRYDPIYTEAQIGGKLFNIFQCLEQSPSV